MQRIDKPIRAMIYLAVLFGLAQVGLAQQKSGNSPNKQPIKFGAIQNKTFFDERNGCVFRLSADAQNDVQQYILFTDAEGNAMINLDGEDIKLKLKRTKEPKGETRMGSKATDFFDGPGVSVTVEYTDTSPKCPPNEACENSTSNATIVVIRGNQRAKVKVKGRCTA